MSLFPRLSLSLLTFLSTECFADATPSTDEIFAAENVRGVLRCSDLAAENRYCEQPVLTVDPQSGKTADLTQLRHIYLTGGDAAGYLFVHDQKNANTTDSYFLVDTATGRAWVQARTERLRDLEAAMAELTGVTTYQLNPRLREVYLTKDGKQPIAAEDVFAAKDNPNEQIGVLEIRSPEVRFDESLRTKFLAEITGFVGHEYRNFMQLAG